jgi:hypothetical protein
VKCLSIISTYYTNVTTILPADFSNGDLSSLSLETSYLLKNVDPLVKACIWSADDAADTYFPWGFGNSDLIRIGLNLGYRLGNIYDIVYEMVNIFTLTMVNGYLNDLEWQYVGSLPGRILSEVFYPSEYEDLTIVYPAEE